MGGCRVSEFQPQGGGDAGTVARIGFREVRELAADDRFGHAGMAQWDAPEVVDFLRGQLAAQPERRE